jgi:tetratricopeptide (TPR) repeat protein
MGLFNFLKPKQPPRKNPAVANARLVAIQQSHKAGQEAWDAGDLAEAEKQLRVTIASASEIGTDGDNFRCRALSGLSAVQTRQGDFESAERSLDSAIEIITTRNWQNSIAHLYVMLNTAVLRWQQGNRNAALNVLVHAHSIVAPRANTATDQLLVAELLGNLIGYHAETGAIAEAARWFNVARDYVQQYGEHLPRQWSVLFHRVPRVLSDPLLVLETLKANAVIFEQKVPREHPANALVFADLGTAYLSAGKPEEAKKEFAKASISRDGVDGLAKSQLANGLGMLALGSKDYQLAEVHFRDAIARSEKGGLGKVRYALSLNNLAVAIREQGRPAEAEPMLREAVQLFEGAFGPNHFHVANAMKNLGQAQQMLGYTELARELYEQALSCFAAAQKSGGPIAAKSAETRKLLDQLLT